MSHRMLKICLVVSLAVNLLVLGAVGGFFGSGRHKDVRLDGFSTRQEARQRGPMTSLGLWCGLWNVRIGVTWGA